MTSKSDAREVVLVLGEFLEAHARFLKGWAELEEKHPEAVKALLEVAKDPVAFGGKLVADLEEEELVLMVRASHKYSRIQQQFVGLSAREKLEIAQQLEDVAAHLKQALERAA